MGYDDDHYPRRSYYEREARNKGIVTGFATALVAVAAIGGMIALVLYGLHH